MNHPDKLLKILFGIVCVVFLALLFLLIVFNITQPQEISPAVRAVIVVASIVFYCALFALWIYWLRYFWRTSQSSQFWICFLVPYLYAAYRTAKHLRAPSSGGA